MNAATPETTSTAARRNTVHFEKERGITDVAVVRGIAHIVATFPEGQAAEERLTLLQTLAAENVPVFLVKLIPSGLTFALREGHVEAGAVLLVTQKVNHVLQRDLGAVTIMAGAMRDLSGVMAAIYEALVSEGITVRQTGDAYNAVQCLVDGSDADRAAQVLRERFGLAEAAETSAEPVSEVETG